MLKSTKNVWKRTKTTFFLFFCLILRAGWHAKAGRLPELFLKFLSAFDWFRSFFVNLCCANHVCWYKLTKKTEISQKQTKNIKKFKNQPKKDNFEVPPRGVDQLLHVNQLWGVSKQQKKHVFFCSFLDVFCWFQPWNYWKRFEIKAGRKTQHTTHSS